MYVNELKEERKEISRLAVSNVWTQTHFIKEPSPPVSIPQMSGKQIV